MKPKIFIASSKEQLDLAYAAQEGLEHDCEATVRNQGVFQLSKSAMSSLVDVLEETDFALFVFAPDDVADVRSETVGKVRDNVVFELGLFAGKLGIERCFMVIPRNVDDLQIPSDLLGLTPVTYEPHREDMNLLAALGPACNRLRKTIRALGAKSTVSSSSINAETEPSETEDLISDKADCLLLLRSWMGQRTPDQNQSVIRYAEVDRELGFRKGSTKDFIEEASKAYYYETAHKGEKLIQFMRDEEDVVRKMVAASGE